MPRRLRSRGGLVFHADYDAPVRYPVEDFTAEERAAMKERAKEVRAAAKGKASRESDAAAVLAKIAELPDDERALAERVHDVVTAEAP